MKNLKFPILVVLFLSVFMMSCSKEEVKSFEIKDATEIMNEFNIAKQEFQKGEVVYGETYIRSTDDQQLLVFVRNTDFDQRTLLYKLQTEKLENPFFEEVIGKAQIFYFRNQLVVNDLESSRRFSLRLSDADNNLKVEEEGLLISGFGLARMTVDLAANNNAVLRGDDDDNPLQSAGGEPGTSQPPVATSGCVCFPVGVVVTCASGGNGSDTCSGAYQADPNGGSPTNCAVSCTTGNFACCDLKQEK